MSREEAKAARVRPTSDLRSQVRFFSSGHALREFGVRTLVRPERVRWFFGRPEGRTPNVLQRLAKRRRLRRFDPRRTIDPRFDSSPRATRCERVWSPDFSPSGESAIGFSDGLKAGLQTFCSAGRSIFVWWRRSTGLMACKACLLLGRRVALRRFRLDARPSFQEQSET